MSHATNQQTSGSPAQRNPSFDCLRCFSAFLIVYLHCPFPGVWGAYCITIARAGVPLFFMMTGYFYTQNASKSRHFTQMKKIFLLMLGGNFLYLAWELLVCLLIGRSASEFIARFFTLPQILRFLLLNDSPFAGHLWYLGAMLYLLVLVYLADRFGLRNLLVRLSPFLLALSLLLGQYSFLLGRTVPIAYYRNFLLFGLPCFYLGAYLRKKSATKKGAFLPEKMHLYLGCSILFSITSLLEGWVFMHLYGASGDCYVSSIALAVALFHLTLTCSAHNISKNNRIATLAAKVGAQYSLMIYLVHPLIVICADIIIIPIGTLLPPLATLYHALGPILVFIAALIAAICWHWAIAGLKTLRTPH